MCLISKVTPKFGFRFHHKYTREKIGVRWWLETQSNPQNYQRQLVLKDEEHSTRLVNKRKKTKEPSEITNDDRNHKIDSWQ